MTFCKKILYVLPLATLLALVGCGPSGNSFRLKGTISGMESGEIYIYNTSNENARFDTLRIENGQFFYGGVAEEPTPYILVYPNALEQVVFIGPGEEIEYEAVSNDLNNYKAKGSEENKQMNSFRSETQNASYSDIQAKARKFISENPKSYVSLYLLDRYFVQNAQTIYSELEKVTEMLRPTFQDNLYYMALQGQVKAMKSINVGDAFPDLKLKSKNKVSNLWKTNSSHTLFLCWTTWIPESYDIISKIRQASSENNANRLRIVALSLDSEQFRWENMTRYDSLTTIEHYIDTRALGSPHIKKIGVNKFPTYFLMDGKHKVIARGNNTTQMMKDINKHVND